MTLMQPTVMVLQGPRQDAMGAGATGVDAGALLATQLYNYIKVGLLCAQEAVAFGFWVCCFWVCCFGVHVG